MFLEVVTRTYKRPTLLSRNQVALKAQTDPDWKQTVIKDGIGIGIGATYVKLRTRKVTGDYVWLLDDDDMVITTNFVATMKQAISLAPSPPDVVIVKGTRGSAVLPDEWPPALGHIGMMNFIVSKKVWEDHSGSFGDDYTGDWFFINSVMQAKPKMLRVPGVHVMAQQISLGLSEVEFAAGGKDSYRRIKASGLQIGSPVECIASFAGDLPLGGTLTGEPGKVIIATAANIDFLESILRGGLAKEVGLYAPDKRTHGEGHQ